MSEATNHMKYFCDEKFKNAWLILCMWYKAQLSLHFATHYDCRKKIDQFEQQFAKSTLFNTSWLKHVTEMIDLRSKDLFFEYHEMIK